MAGFFLPLSGGLDSASVAALVGSMCALVIRECEKEKGKEGEGVRAEVKSVLGGRELPLTGKELTRWVTMVTTTPSHSLLLLSFSLLHLLLFSLLLHLLLLSSLLLLLLLFFLSLLLTTYYMKTINSSDKTYTRAAQYVFNSTIVL